MEKKIAEDGKCIHSANWELVCKPKKYGGLGIINIQVFNDALLAKWYWYWIRPDDRLWKSVFRVAFDFSDNSELPDCKFFRENFHGVVNFCENYTQRIVESGMTIKFWMHNWGQGHLKFELQDLFKEVRNKGIMVNQVFQIHNIEELFHDMHGSHFK